MHVPSRWGMLALLIAIAMPPGAAAQSCGMVRVATHAGSVIRASTRGPAAIHFRADLDVNTDGSSRSYHPQDPQGRTQALNNIVNAITFARDDSGAVINCTPKRGACYMRYVRAFEQMRDADWSPSGARVETDGIIPWETANGKRVPCTIKEGPAAGFFVSQTAFAADPSRRACDQQRYLDSLQFNAVVLPRGAAWRSNGEQARVGDLAVVRNPANGKVAFAVVGDTGPAGSLGEGTIALAASLRGASLSGSETYQQIRALALPAADYLIFAGARVREHVSGPLTQAAIDQAGKELFDQWGGEQRLAACTH